MLGEVGLVDEVLDLGPGRDVLLGTLHVVGFQNLIRCSNIPKDFPPFLPGKWDRRRCPPSKTEKEHKSESINGRQSF